MIIENTEIQGIKCELRFLDETMNQLGFVREQWEYYRATYDYKITDQRNDDVYYLRINTRAVEGKLEAQDAVLSLEDVYIGKDTFPAGVDYDAAIPDHIMKTAKDKLNELKNHLV